MAVTNTAALPPAVAEYYDRLLLMTAYPALVHTRFAQKRILPKKSGNTIVFRRYARMSTVPIPIQDGVTPPGAALSASNIQAQVQWYGNFVTITDQVELTVEDRVLNEASRLLAQNMGQTLDELTRDVLAATSSVLQCSNGVNGSTPSELTKADIDGAVQSLLNNDAEMISQMVVASERFATAPVRPAFWGFIDTALLDDLEAVANFEHSSSYSNNKAIQDNEWGATGNVRWLYTSVGSVSSATPAVYNNIIVGKEAYAVVNLGSEEGEFYVEPLGSAGAGDPLHQRGSVGWKIPFVARILNDSFMVNLMATHS